MKRTNLPELRDGDWSNQAYRGYLIKRNALSNHMWVEKEGHRICTVPADQSWQWAREQIDALVSA